MPVKSTRLGNGTLTLGEGTPMDVSAQVVGAVLSSALSMGDTLTVLTGEQISSGIATESAFAGTMILDPYVGGVGEYTWLNHGLEVQAIFTPNTDAGLSATFNVIIARLDIGADEYGALLQPEFEWTVVGEPAIAWGIATP